MTTPETADRGAATAPRLLVGLGLGAAAACVVVSAVAAGWPGFWGGLLGAAIALAFSGFTLAVLRPLTRPATGTTMLVALMLFGTKVLALVAGALLLSASGLLASAVDRRALGVTMIVCVLVVTLLEVVAFVRRREPLYDLDRAPDLGEGR